MPTSEYEDDEVEKLYDTIEEILEEDGKGDTNIILGDWNSIVGDEPYRNIVGSHGLGRRNHRGLAYSVKNILVIENSTQIVEINFLKPPRTAGLLNVDHSSNKHIHRCQNVRFFFANIPNFHST